MLNNILQLGANNNPNLDAMIQVAKSLPVYARRQLVAMLREKAQIIEDSINEEVSGTSSVFTPDGR